MIAGQGTAAKELIEEVGPLDALFVCLGGGGLLSGSALATRHLSRQDNLAQITAIVGALPGQRFTVSGNFSCAAYKFNNSQGRRRFCAVQVFWPKAKTLAQAEFTSAEYVKSSRYP